MITRRALMLVAGLLAWVTFATSAATLSFFYRPPAGGAAIEITSLEQLRQVIPVATDIKAYYILQKYLSDVAEIKARVNGMTTNIKVTVNSCTDPTQVPDAGWEPGSWSSGPDIQVQDADFRRAISTLAHEVGHSYMKEKFGQNPTHGMTQEQKYGADKSHYTTEVTNPRTAFSEGFAEYLGDLEGTGQERIGCLGRPSFESTHKEEVYQGADGKWYVRYNATKWKDITAADDMWACEGVNAAILRDIARYLPDGANKIQTQINAGYSETLQGFLKKLIAANPSDANRIAAIVDCNTNFLMSDGDLNGLLDGHGDYVAAHRGDVRTRGQGRSPCDTLPALVQDRWFGGSGLPSPHGRPRPGAPGPNLPKFR